MTVVYYKSWVIAILLSHKLIQNSGISESSRNLQKVNCNIFCYMIAPFIRFFLLPIGDLLSYVYFLPANSLDKCLTFLFMIWLSQLTQQFFIIVHDTFNAMETLERVTTRILKKSMIYFWISFFFQDDCNLKQDSGIALNNEFFFFLIENNYRDRNKDI